MVAAEAVGTNARRTEAVGMADGSKVDLISIS